MLVRVESCGRPLNSGISPLCGCRRALSLAPRGGALCCRAALQLCVRERGCSACCSRRVRVWHWQGHVARARTATGAPLRELYVSCVCVRVRPQTRIALSLLCVCKL